MLKKSSFILFFLMLIGFSVSAQNIRNGLIAGFTASQIDGDQKSGFDKGGLMFGGSSAFILTKKLSLQPEILFVQKGSRSRDKDPDFLNYRLNYVSLPVVVGYRFTPKFTFQGGLTGDFLLKAKYDDSGSGFLDVTDNFHRFDLNVTGGIEYQLGDYFGFNARYMYSVTPAATAFRYNFYNNTIGVSLRYYFSAAPEF